MSKKRKPVDRNGVNLLNTLLGLGVVVLVIFLIYKGMTSIRGRDYSPKTSPSPIPDETVDWKTYTNITPEYSFKYPPNLLLSEGDSFVVISDPNDNGKKAGLGVIKITQIKPGLARIKTLEKYSNGSLDGYTETVRSGKYITKYVYLNNNGSNIGLIFSGLSNIDDKEIPIEQFANYNIFNRILSTFKFSATVTETVTVSTTPTATTLPVRGDKKEYSDSLVLFKYPGDWLAEIGNSRNTKLPENTVNLVNTQTQYNITVISQKNSSDPRSALKEFVVNTFGLTNTEVISSDNKIAKGYFTQKEGSSNVKINIVYLTNGVNSVVLTSNLPSDKLQIFYSIIDSIKFTD